MDYYQAFLRFDQRPVDAVHLVIQAARVAQVMSGPVPAPQRRGHGAAVDALAALTGNVIHQFWSKEKKKLSLD